MFRIIWKKKIVIIVAVLLVALLPVALTKEPLALSRAIVTSIGIEKDGDEYTIFTETLLFNFDPFGVPEREIFSASSESIEKALIEIGRDKGKIVSLSHCTVIVLGNSLADDNLVELLDFFLKRSDISNSAALFWTGGSVETLMQASIDQGDARSGLLQRIATFNRRNSGFTSTNLERFMKDMLSGRESRVAYIIVEDDKIVNEGDFRRIQQHSSQII